MTSKRFTWLLLGCGSLLWFAGAQTERSREPGREIMWRKLDLTHDALDAVSLDDFEALEAYAADLTVLSKASDWLASDNEAFRQESVEFRRSAEELGRAAMAKDSGAAALAYVDLTLRCLRCHRLLGSVPPR